MKLRKTSIMMIGLMTNFAINLTLLNAYITWHKWKLNVLLRVVLLFLFLTSSWIFKFLSCLGIDYFVLKKRFHNLCDVSHEEIKLKNQMDLVAVCEPSIVNDPPEVHHEIGSSWSTFDVPWMPWLYFGHNVVSTSSKQLV